MQMQKGKGKGNGKGKGKRKSGLQDVPATKAHLLT